MVIDGNRPNDADVSDGEVGRLGAYREQFRHRHTVLPVIHVEELEQALRNTGVARDADCDGVFLINHCMTDTQLLDIHAEVAARFPDWWIGVNCLGLNPDQAFPLRSQQVSGLWVDNAMIDERSAQQVAAEAIASAREQSGWQGLYFGGVAFKYQRPVEDLAAAARISAEYMDVVTTIGAGTGLAADRDKIMAMKNALGDVPLAIASGVTPDNIGDYLVYADCFLVATGIGSSFSELDPTLVEALVSTVRSYEG